MIPEGFDEEKFWSKVEKPLGSDCWLWNGAIREHGYGIIFCPNKINVHRISWELLVKPLEKRERLYHLCSNQNCVNPNHLRSTYDKIGCFWDKVNKNGENGCWLWTGATKIGDYGEFRFNDGKKWRTHCLSWFLTNGDIPKGMFVCHKCDIRLCCNPDHLFLGTAKDNSQDALKKGRLNLSGLEIGRLLCNPKNRCKTHCPQGHEYSKENTYISKNNCRQCKICAKNRTYKSRMKKK